MLQNTANRDIARHLHQILTKQTTYNNTEEPQSQQLEWNSCSTTLSHLLGSKLISYPYLFCQPPTAVSRFYKDSQFTPLLFTLYTNYAPSPSQTSTTPLAFFADDTAVLTTSQTGNAAGKKCQLYTSKIVQF